MSTTAATEPVTPSKADTALAREAGRRLALLAAGNLRIRVSESEDPIELPAGAVRLLQQLLSEMAAGNAVKVLPIHRELTTQEAADLLGVSRPFLIRQLEEGLIPYHKVGTHRRIHFRDLMAYKRQIDRRRRQALDELARQAQELNLGY